MQTALQRSLLALTLASTFCMASNADAQTEAESSPDQEAAQVDAAGDNSAESAPPAGSGDETESTWERWQKKADPVFGKYLVDPLVMVLFVDLGVVLGLKYLFGIELGVPLLVAWLTAGATFFTLRMGFINFRAFGHALRVTRGDFDNPNDTGEVTHFQALCSALSATIGLGNIAGVAIAVGTGGPGAIFWMVLAGFIGMTSKFVECTLAQMYRHVDVDGRVTGGPMRYLHHGLAEMGLKPLGAVLAVVFTILCIGGSFGGGCAFQVVQSLGVLKTQIPLLEQQSWIYGAIMVFFVGIVIIGGIRRIASTAEKIVPLMCIIYSITALAILAMKYTEIPNAFLMIFEGAFTGEGIKGGILGVMVVGIKRAAFSNEAGIGSAAIAHSAAKTEHPVREGIVALLGPFIDTVVICTMTGLVIVITGAYDIARFPAHEVLINTDQGAVLTSNAFGGVVSWFPIVLAIAATFFAYSTMISWSYYGERCFTHLFGQRSSLAYKLIFLGFVFLGSVVTATNILVFSDLMILSMAFPNILGLVLLSGKVRRALDEYWKRYKAGEFKTYK